MRVYALWNQQRWILVFLSTVWLMAYAFVIVLLAKEIQCESDNAAKYDSRLIFVLDVYLEASNICRIILPPLVGYSYAGPVG